MLDLPLVHISMEAAVSAGKKTATEGKQSRTQVLFPVPPLCLGRVYGCSLETRGGSEPFYLSNFGTLSPPSLPRSAEEGSTDFDPLNRGGVYNSIFHGAWQAYDPWESSSRLPAISDLYNGPGGCSMFRMFQGWLSMSTTSAGEGTLMVNPLLGKATAYFLLRPFFAPKKTAAEISSSDFLDSDNWLAEDETSSVLQGAVPSNCQELNTALHPHLDLANTMVHIPTVRPGDYVAWHSDTIHAVDSYHAGTTDSSVMYVPCCPLTEANVEYLVRQRETFFEGTPGPDFPSGEGEKEFVGRLTPDFVMGNISAEAQRGMGLARYDVGKKGMVGREREILERANEILRF